MSSRTPIRPSGMRATDVRAISACCSAVSGMPAVSLATPSVATPPGAMALIWIPWGASSSARFLVNMSTPPLEASYAARPTSDGRRLSMEAMLTILPPFPWAIICFAEPGVVDEDLQRAKLPQACGHDLFAGARVGDVGTHRGGLARAAGQFPDGCLRRLIVNVRDQHVGPGLDEPLRDAEANAHGPAGDGGVLSREIERTPSGHQHHSSPLP